MGATATADDPIQQAAAKAVEKAKQQRLFQFSGWLHVGPGAEACDEGEQSTCSNPLHFHAWCRLPNQFQHKEIRERALAAKARKARQLRDPDSDSAAILEGAIEDLRREGETAKESVVDELLERSWLQSYNEARREVDEERDESAPQAEDEFPLKWEHIGRDKERLGELRELPEDQVNAEELAELEKHVGAYDDRVTSTFDERRKPEREALLALTLDQLLDQLREMRIDIESNAEFEHVYAVHQWLECVLTKPNGEPRFSSMGQLIGAAPETLEGLQLLYRELEIDSFRRRAEGNS